MPRLLPSAALLTLSFAASAGSIPVKPAWTLRDANFRGFSDGGEVITQPGIPRTGPAPELQRRDPATGGVVSTTLVPEAGDDLGLLTPTPDLQTLAWLNRAGDTLTVRTPERRWTSGRSGLLGTQSLTFSPDGRTLAAMNVFGYVQLWDVATGRRRATLLLRSQPRGLSFHPSRPLLAVNETSYTDSVTLWDTGTGERTGTVPGLKGTLRPFLFAPDGTLLVPAPRYTVAWVAPGTGRVVRTLPTFVEPCGPGVPFKLCARGVYGASFRVDGGQVLITSSERRGNTTGLVARLYDVPGGNLLKTFDTPGAGAALSPDAKTLILNSYTGELQGAPLP